MKNEPKYVLYYHVSKSGEVFYVGIGDIRRPYSTHHRSKFWWNVAKSGYDVVVAEGNLSWEMAQERERYWIKYYGRRDIGTGILVNMTDGGDGARGSKWSEQRVVQMSDRFSREGNPFYGRKHSESAITKNSIAHTGIKQSVETTEKRSAALTGVRRPEDVKRSISRSRKTNPPIVVTTRKDISKVRSKLTEQEVRDIRLLSENFSYRELAKKYNMACSTISKIVNRQSFTHI